MSNSNHSSSLADSVDVNSDHASQLMFDARGELQAAIDSLQHALREAGSDRSGALQSAISIALEVSSQLANLCSRCSPAADTDNGAPFMKTHALATLSMTIGQLNAAEEQPAIVVMHDVELILPRIRRRIEQINARIREGLPILSVDGEPRPLTAPVTHEMLIELGLLLQTNTLDRVHLEPIPEYARDLCDDA